MLRFKEEGNESIQKRKSDLVFVIEEIGEDKFARVGENLFYTTTITLVDAFECKPVFIETLDGRSLRVGLDEIPKYLFCKVVQIR